jgi:hypothetical protein
MNAELTAFLDWDSVAGNRLEFELGSHFTMDQCEIFGFGSWKSYTIRS